MRFAMVKHLTLGVIDYRVSLAGDLACITLHSAARQDGRPAN
jgi:hypothetical protein